MASKGTIGAKIALEGESAYRQALKNINSEQKQLRSEMKLCTSTFSDQQNSLTALTSKHQILAKQYEVQQNKVAVYATAVENSAKKQKEAADKVEALQTALTAARLSMEEMSKTSDATEESMEEQRKTVADLEDQLALANSDYDKATQQTNKYKTSLNYAEAELNDLSSELQTNERYLDEAEHSMNDTAQSIDKYGDEVEDASDKTAGFGTILSANLSTAAIITGIKALANAIKEVSTACINTGMEFEASMSKVRALSGATETDMSKLTDKAKEMGATTMFSASQSADAFSYMALAGWDVEEMLEGIEPVLSLAAAADMDLAQASDIVTDYLTAFGLSASETAQFTDQLAYAMSNSNTNVEQLGEAYKNCASTATSLGYSVEDVTAVLMTMANAGVKGGEAGTGLSTIMTRLATNTKNCADELMSYGVAVYDQEGNMNSLSDILEGLEHIWAGLSDQEQAALAKTIAGTQQYSKLQTIMNGVSETAQSGGNSFYDYAKALENVDGAAKNMANTMQDNLKGKLTILGSAMDALKTSAYETFDETLKQSVDEATSAVSRLNDSVANGDMHTSLTNLSESLGNFLSDAVDVAEDALPKLIDGFTWFLDNLDVVASGVTGVMTSMMVSNNVVPLITKLVAAWKAYAIETEGATVKQWLLNTAMNANPVGLLTTALAGLTAGLVTYYALNKDEMGTLTDVQKKTKELAEESEKLNKTYEDNIKARKQTRDDIQKEATIADNLVNRLDELNRVESLSAEQKAEVSSIVAQLNSNYDGLNLTIDENTGKVNESTDAIRNQIQALKDEAMASAVYEDLKKASSELWEAQKLLEEQETQLAEAHKETEQATAELDEAMTNVALAFGTGGSATYAYQQNVIAAKNSEAELEGQIQSTKDTIDQLNGEIDTCTEYLAGNETQVESSTEAIEGLSNAESEAKAQAEGWGVKTREAWANLEEATAKAVEGQMNAFEEFNGGAEVSSATLKKNLQSQIDGLINWSNNMQTLAQRGVSEGLLTELAKMGPEGSSYVQAFVSMSDAELADYDQKFASYVKIGDSVSSDIADSFASTGEAAAEGFAKGIATPDEVEEASRELGQYADKALRDELKVNSPSKVTEEIGKFFDEGLQTGIQRNKGQVISTINSMTSEVRSVAQSGLSSSYFYSMGINVDQGLANGIAAGRSRVINEVIQLARSAVQTAKDELGVASPSKKFKYLGEMLGAGLKVGWQEEMADIDNVIASALPDTNMIASSFDATSFKSALSDINANERLNPEEIYNAIREGASDADIKLSIGSKDFGRLLKGMGVNFG